tara:strand:+ start:151 stop:447 length:297 start_codon:yes stop_codon:yes gene_type:complete
MIITVIILSIVVIAAGVAVRNLTVKVERYEDITMDQAKYLQNISKTIEDSQKHLKNLDEKGVFQGEDEVGYFFNQMMNVQKELDRYMLPQNYGKKEEQ